MKLLDLNILLYAINADSPKHTEARRWLEDTLSGDELVGLPWVVLLGFLRITTNPRVMSAPLSPADAVQVVDGWLDRPVTRVLSPGEGHWAILRGLLLDAGTAGNLTTDAHLAALAIEKACTLCSTDADFARFRHVKWHHPLLPR